MWKRAPSARPWTFRTKPFAARTRKSARPAKRRQARYALEGASTYPDATGTLRLAFGVVKGYEQDGQPVPFQTTFAGLYERARQQGLRAPFDLPPRWVAARKKLNLSTPD